MQVSCLVATARTCGVGQSLAELLRDPHSDVVELVYSRGGQLQLLAGTPSLLLG